MAGTIMTARNPLVIFPSVYDVLPNFGFVDGVSGTDTEHWNSVVGGGSTISYVTGFGEQLGTALKYSKASGQICYVQTQTLRFTPFLLPGTGLNLNIYARLRLDAQTGNPVWALRPDYYNGASGYLSSGTAMSLTMGTDVAADSTWRIYRLNAGTINAATAAMGAPMGFTGATATTATLYCDWVFFAFDVNFLDLGPYARGAFIEDRLPLSKRYDRRRQDCVDGTRELQLWNPGWRDASFKSSPISDAGRTIVRGFVNHARRGVPYSIARDQSDLSANFIKRMQVDPKQRGDGLKQIAAGLHTWEFASREVR